MTAQVARLPELKPHYTVAETAIVLNETIDGKPLASALFREAMVRSDMPLTFNQIVNAEMIPQYQNIQPVWQEFSRRITLRDLTEQSYIEIWPDLSTLPPRENGRARIKNKAPRIGANNEYPAVVLNESTATVKADKYGLRMPLTIEMIINDQLDALANYPEALAVYMRLLEDILTVEALIADNGQGIRGGIPRLAAGNAPSTGAAVPVNSPLTFEAVELALQQMSAVEVHGIRTGISGTRLVVPRTLELAARAIVGTSDREVTQSGVMRVVPNAASGLGVSVVDALTWVNIAASANTTWFLVAGSSGTIGRPSLVTGFLRQYQNPQLFISSPNALTPAGGLANWADGSFLNDSIEFKARHFAGAKLVYNEGIIASDGTGA